MNKLTRMLSAIKNKIDDRKTKKLEKQIIQLNKNNAKLEQQLAELQAGRISEVIETIGMDPTTDKGDDSIKKCIYEKGPDELDKGEKSQSRKEGKEDIKTMKSNFEKEKTCLKRVRKTCIINKQQRKKSRKRCHFCRKRGHIQRDCPGRQMIWNWLWDDVNAK